MMEDDKIINDLVRFAKVLTKVNQVRGEYEKILKELTIFNNFNKFWEKERKNSIFESQILKATENENGTNSVIIQIKNNSEIFEFNRQFWRFCLEFKDSRGGGGEYLQATASSWTLESGESFKPGNIERFVYCLTPSEISRPRPVKIKIYLSFLLEWNEENFIQNYDIGTLQVDILHFLSPERKLLIENNPFYSLSRFSTEENTKIIPPISNFEIRVNHTLFNKFLNLIIPKESLNIPQSQAVQIQSESEPVPGDPIEISFYYSTEKIVIIKNPKNSTFTFRCANSIMLIAIKNAILKRLLSAEGIKVNSPDQNNCEKIHNLYLQLESFCLNETLHFSDYVEIYLKLRQVTQHIVFSI